MMKDLHLPPFSTVIAPSYLHPMLRLALTKQNDGCIGIRIYSLSSYLLHLEHDTANDMVTTLFTYREKLKTQRKTFTIFKSLLSTSDFLNECHHFMEQMKFYHVMPEQLPDITKTEIELKQIISLLYYIPTRQTIINKALEVLQDGTKLFIIDAFYTLEEQEIIQHFIHKGAVLLPIITDVQHKEFYHAINMRQEIEACAQYIIQHQLKVQDCIITLASKSYQPVLMQVFQRYQIPFTLLQHSQTSIITQRFTNLIRYLLTLDIQDFFTCVEAGLFHVAYIDEFREYTDLFQLDIFDDFQHVQSIQTKGHILEAFEIDKLSSLEQKANLAKAELLPWLSALIHLSIQEQIERIIHIVKESMEHASYDDIQVFCDIQECFEHSYPYVKNKDDLCFLLALIKNITIHHSVHELQGAIITELNQTIPGYSHHFILGATQKNYPAFQAKNGIFDEDYWKKTPLPTMETRYQQHMLQSHKLLNISNHLIISYPLGSYEGKSNEAALEIEQLIQTDSIHYPLTEYFMKPKRTYELQGETAQALFVHNNMINASISAIERYVHCPYAYFLRYGLSIREPMKHGFDVSYMGTMTHYILETIVQQHGKVYASITQEQLERIVDNEIIAMQEVFINQKDRISVIKQRFMESFQQTLRRLQDFEQHSALNPWRREYEFHHTFPIDEQYSFTLKGYIDRIDATNNYLSIIDYKSSVKSLHENNVFAALQLQLITYAVIAKHDFNKSILGAYYISLKNENIPHAAGKMKRRPIEYRTIDKGELTQDLQKAHRLNGWTLYRDIDILDDDGTHVSGVRMNKDGVVKSRIYYRYDALEYYLQAMYRIIGHRILSGDISCCPDADACLFCEYAQICKFKGFPTEKKPLMETDEEQLYWEGGDMDANME